MSGADWKATEGIDSLFIWPAPGPLSAGPTLTVRHPDNAIGNVSPALTVVRSSVSVTAVANDGRALTLGSNIGASTRGLTGEPYGRAWLDAGEAGQYPCTVAGFTAGTTAYLADALPRRITVGSGATLYWLTYTATLPAASICSAARRNIPFHITYTVRAGGDAPAAQRRDEGRIHVVRQIFQTGCNDDHLLTAAASLGRSLPARQDSYARQIMMAERTLIRWIHQRMRAAGKDPYEDRLDGRPLVDAHAYLALGIVLASQEAGGADTGDAITRAAAAAQAAFEEGIDPLPFLDEDDDGVVDSGETDVSLPALPSIAGGYFTAAQLSTDEDDGYRRASVLDER